MMRTMTAALPLLVIIMMVGTHAAPNSQYEYYMKSEKRAAIVLDRLLIALKNALHDNHGFRADDEAFEEPRAAPLRYEPNIYYNDMVIPNYGQSDYKPQYNPTLTGSDNGPRTGFSL